MASEHKLTATSRSVEGKGASRRLRRSEQCPAILYGANQAPKNIQVEHNHLWLASQNEWFYSAILHLDVDGKTEKVLLRDMQRHPFKQQILHLDFLRIDETSPIRFKLPLHFLNQEVSPAGKTAGVVVTHELNEVEVMGLAKDLPEFIEVDLSALTIGDILHMSNIKLPAGVTIPALKLGKEHDLAIVIAKHARVEAEEIVAAPAEVPSTKAGKAAAAPAAAKPAAKKK